MAYIKFADKESPIKGSVKVINENLIRIISNDEPDISGFSLFIDANMQMPMSHDQYSEFKTLYNSGEGWYELSNDGSIYVKPVPVVKFSISETYGTLNGELEQSVEKYEDLVIPTVEPAENYTFKEWSPEIPTEGDITSDINFVAEMEYVPTIEDIRAAKISEMSASKEYAVGQGFNVTLTDGSVEHFSLSNEDQLYLTALQTSVLAGQDPIPWHVSDASIPCKEYSNADMAIITGTAMNIIVYHVTYLKDITRYINSIEDKETLNKVTYGMVIPEEFQSEPLKNMMAQMNA